MATRARIARECERSTVVLGIVQKVVVIKYPKRINARDF